MKATIITRTIRDGVPTITLTSDFLQVEVAPSVGGRIVSIRERSSGYEFLWRNRRLRLEGREPGSSYDPNFYGGMDELLPNDIPETISGIECPDHGELWTTALEDQISESSVKLTGRLPRFGLTYERTMSLRPDGPWLDLDYRITNSTNGPRTFLWKLHPALNIQPGDLIECPARQARVVDLAWSRQTTLEPFAWPILNAQPVNVIPARDGTVDFFYLYDLPAGEIAWHRPSQGLLFACHFEQSVFPFAWLFASYGGFDGHYTAVLEPCTAMPISVNDAAARGQCSRLDAGQELLTRVSLYAGPRNRA